MSKPDAAESCDPDLTLVAIAVQGRDAGPLLQALLSADLGAMPEATLRPAALCDPKGRVQQVVLTGKRDDCWQIFLPRACGADVHARLELMRIGRDAEAQPPCPAGPATPPEGMALEFDRARGLDTTAAPSDSPARAWLRADIDAGLAWILPATAGRFLPQMLGLEALDGLSYRKGCFPGQEVIARVHYRGRVTSRLARFAFDAGRAPRPGAGLALDDGGTATVLYTDVPEGAAVRGGVGLAVVPAATPAGARVTAAALEGRLNA